MVENPDNSSVLSEVKEMYAWLIEQGDVRVKDWLFVTSPLPGVSYMAVYLLCLWIGPKLMANRKPFDLGHTLALYNFALVGLSSYMAYEFFMSAYLAGYSLGCQPVDYSDTPIALRMASVCWWYYISKYIEVADTIFFILRKKNNQITFLHVFHHSTMIINWWSVVKFIAGGAVFFHALLNSFVHVIMYTYYGLAALGPAVQPYLWWKKYVTKIQLIQFTMIVIHASQCLTRVDCMPRGFVLLAIFYAVAMILLFANYYYHEMKRKRCLSSPRPNQELTNGHLSDSELIQNGTHVSNGARRRRPDIGTDLSENT